jgi:hypothetical protein
MNPYSKSFAALAKALVYLRYPTVLASKRHLVPYRGAKKAVTLLKCGNAR